MRKLRSVESDGRIITDDDLKAVVAYFTKQFQYSSGVTVGEYEQIDNRTVSTSNTKLLRYL